MDKVFIEGLTVDAVIGVYDWEQQRKQSLILDLEIAWDNQPAAESDQLDDALDYDALSQAVIELIQSRPRALIETVAEEVAQLAIQQFSVPQIRVKVMKPTAIAAARHAAVEIVRSRA